MIGRERGITTSPTGQGKSTTRVATGPTRLGEPSKPTGLPHRPHRHGYTDLNVRLWGPTIVIASLRQNTILGNLLISMCESDERRNTETTSIHGVMIRFTKRQRRATPPKRIEKGGNSDNGLRRVRASVAGPRRHHPGQERLRWVSWDELT
jgi:hypothetical protein